MGNVTLYIADEDHYRKLLLEIKNNWYKLHHESLNKSDTVIRALEFLSDYSKGCIELQPTSDPTKKYSRFPGV